MRNIQLKSTLTLILLGFTLNGCEKSVDEFPYEEEVLLNVVKPNVIDEYIYPVRPGTEAWSYLRTENERFIAMQLPDSVLQTISTWGLISTCFNYPAYGFWSAYDNISGYMDGLSERFNGLKELFARDNVTGTLLYTYRNLDHKEFNNPIKFSFAELIIGSDKFISLLDKKQKIYLVSIALSKYGEESNNPDIGEGSSIFVMGNVMLNAGYQPFIDYCAVKKDYSYGGFLSKFNSPADKIEEFAKRFIKD